MFMIAESSGSSAAGRRGGRALRCPPPTHHQWHQYGTGDQRNQCRHPPWDNDAVTLDKSGKLWRGENFEDLAEYVRHYQAGGYPVAKVAESVCSQCNGRTFRVNINDDESTQRICLRCGAAAFIADSADHWDEADHDQCQCPCGGEEFSIAVGFALFDDGDVRWISVGLRCLNDNVLGVYADVKIDYGPSLHLLSQA
jgi:hypothetical protein